VKASVKPGPARTTASGMKVCSAVSGVGVASRSATYIEGASSTGGRCTRRDGAWALLDEFFGHVGRWRQLQQGIMHETNNEAREAAGSCAVMWDGKLGRESPLAPLETRAAAHTDGANDGTQ
jgi:hypothetical protein